MLSVVETRGRLSGRPAVRIDLRCTHGESAFVLLPGRDSALNVAALELVAARHDIRHGCRCRLDKQAEEPRLRIGPRRERATGQVSAAAS